MFYTLKTYLRLLIVALVVLFIQLSLSISPVLSQDVKIGTQVWTSKNLDVSTFRNGEAIPEAKSIDEWRKASINRTAAWCYYDNDEQNGKVYGKLYNWYAVNDPRGLAPKGYHIPSDDEWTVLTDKLGKVLVGEKLKSKTRWKKMNQMRGEPYTSGNGNNRSGFNGLPGGGRVGGELNGNFHSIGVGGSFWSSSENNTNIVMAWFRVLYFNNNRELVRNGSVKDNGESVRCIKD